MLEKRCAGACIQPFIHVLVILATLSIMIGHACHNYRISYWLTLCSGKKECFQKKKKSWGTINQMLIIAIIFYFLTCMYVHAHTLTHTYTHTYLIMHRILNFSLCDTITPHATQNTLTKEEISKPDPSLFIPIQGQGAHAICNLFI